MSGAAEEQGSSTTTACTSPPGILIITATGSEFRAIAGLISQRKAAIIEVLRGIKGFIGASPVTLANAGIRANGLPGPLEAHLAATRYDAVLVAGLAGGLDPALKVGDIVIYERCLRIQGSREVVDSIACDPKLTARLESALEASGFAPNLETGLTVESMITTSSDKTVLRNRFGAAVVDMESYRLLDSARRAGVPAAVLRVVLDEAGLDTPDFNSALTEGGQLRGWPVTRELVRRPKPSVRFIARLPRAHRMLTRAVKSALSLGRMEGVP